MSVLSDIIKACTYIIANAIIQKCDGGSSLTCTSNGGLSLNMGSSPQNDLTNNLGGYQSFNQLNYNDMSSYSDDCCGFSPNEVDEVNNIIKSSRTSRECLDRLYKRGYKYHVYREGNITRLKLMKGGRVWII